jgi:lactate racemase
MGPTVELPWGGDLLGVTVPDSWTVLGELRPESIQAPDNSANACAAALKEPMGVQRLATRNLAGSRVVVVVDDHSRPTPVREFIRPVLDELAEAGATDQQIDILIATGVHRATLPEEAEWKLGSDVMARFRRQCHDAHDRDGLVSLGTTSRGTRVFLNKLLTEADLIVCVGALEPHLLLGFGGGLKMLMPGCAGAETIGKNHMQGVDPDNFDYVGVRGDRSPMRLDLEEGVDLLNKEIFVVNTAMNEHGKPTRFFCGHPIQAHREGESFIENLAGIEVPEQADVVLVNSFPMDADMRQSMKCIFNWLYACKPGGVMMGCIKCDNGLGELPIPKKTLPYPALKFLLRMIGKNRVLPLVEKAKKGEPIEEVFIGHLGLQMLRRNHVGVFSDSQKLPPDIGKKMGMVRSFTEVQGMVSWARANAPANATVWVLPYGGSTYALPKQWN